MVTAHYPNTLSIGQIYQIYSSLRAMCSDVHPVAIAHFQGMQAGKAPEASPYLCPWPAQDYEAVLAWFAGFSLGVLTNSKCKLSVKVRQISAA